MMVMRRGPTGEAAAPHGPPPLPADLAGRCTERAGRSWGAGGWENVPDRDLHTAVPEDASERVRALERSLAEHGYVEGRNVAFVHRYSGPEVKRLGDLASELVRAGVDVILISTNPSTFAAMKATTTVPIVMTIGVDPVAARLVKSITKPGGNVTGLTFDVDPEQLAAKRLEILEELVPSLVRVGVLWNPTYEPGTLRFKGTEEAGRKLGVAIVSLPLTDPDHVDRVFAEARRARVEAIAVLSDPVTFTRRAQILGRAVPRHLPAIYALREFVADGGLVSYATSLIGQYRRAALYVGKILKGAKPGDLPVEHPIAFELWINRQAARAIGLTIPPSLLARADQVIE